nr:HAD-IC family P-type ATPase [Nitrospiraceae bacterium]
FARAMGVLVLAASFLLFIAGLITGESAREMFMTAVAAAVAAIPEGLPIVVTIAMAIGVARMARHNAIIRKLPAVETLGSTTVICTDKTGTLTKNEMTVNVVYDGRHVYEFTGSGYEPKGEILHEGMRVHPAEEGRLLQVLRIGLLCNESEVYEENGQYRTDGDPTEAALIVSAMKAGLLVETEEETYQQAGAIPFESERGYMAALFAVNGGKLIFVKGAPERMLEMCEIDADGARLDKDAVSIVAGNFAVQGLRVLAFAWKDVSADTLELTHGDIESGLVFAGLQGMIDPPRPEAIKAIEDCRMAGIRVVMITGDHAVTARAIAAQMGISGIDGGVLAGRDLEAMSDEDLFHQVEKVSVFARVAPQHKLRITEQLKRHGEIVAMTGDGVNDAPALKAAHIGIAMGRTGTDVAKEASDMVLADDNFAAIFAAVKEGRIVFDNLRKVTFFLIPTGVAAILSIAGAIGLGVPIPYVSAQLLWINLVTNGLQDVALAFEPGEKNVLARPPRHPGEGIMSRLLIERTVLVGLVISLGVIYTFVSAFRAGESVEKARSVAVTTMVFFQFFQAFNSRSEMQSLFSMNPLDNSFLFFSMIAAFFAQVAFLYMPAFQWVFRTEPITMADWLHILSVSATVIIAVEADKWLRRRRPRIP